MSGGQGTYESVYKTKIFLGYGIASGDRTCKCRRAIYAMVDPKLEVTNGETYPRSGLRCNGYLSNASLKVTMTPLSEVGGSKSARTGLCGERKLSCLNRHERPPTTSLLMYWQSHI